VRQKLNGFKHKYDFIPGDGLDELMTPEYVKEITINLRLNDPSQPFHANTLLNEEDYARVHEKYRVILAILIKLSCEDHFIKFHNYDNAYDDSRLPFSKEELEHIDPQQVICDLFLTTQYEFIPQTISGRHSWTPEFVLPFIGKTDIGDGSFAKVYKVELYPLYDNIKETHFSNSKDVSQLLSLSFPYVFADLICAVLVACLRPQTATRVKRKGFHTRDTCWQTAGETTTSQPPAVACIF
jgi:hypothetical protein